MSANREMDLIKIAALETPFVHIMTKAERKWQGLYYDLMETNLILLVIAQIIPVLRLFPNAAERDRRRMSK